MGKKRLDVWIAPELRDYISEEAKATGKPQNMVTNELLGHAIAARRGEILETQALPLIRQIVQHEVNLALAQWQASLLAEIKAQDQRQADRLAALIVQAARSAGIARRLAFTILARASSQAYAQQAYDDARERVGQELAMRRRSDDDRQE